MQSGKGAKVDNQFWIFKNIATSLLCAFALKNSLTNNESTTYRYSNG